MIRAKILDAGRCDVRIQVPAQEDPAFNAVVTEIELTSILLAITKHYGLEAGNDIITNSVESYLEINGIEHD
jgi:hypothetical protein